MFRITSFVPAICAGALSRVKSFCVSIVIKAELLMRGAVYLFIFHAFIIMTNF